MRTIFKVLLFFLFSSAAYSDPAWLSPNIKKSDCENVFWKTQGACYDRYNRQQIKRLRKYIVDQIKFSNSESCDKDYLIDAFEHREAAWNEYSYRSCDITTHCIGHCGSGHSAANHNCRASMSDQRLTFLESEVKNGSDIWGCVIKGSKENLTLVTKSYQITLTGNCQLGLFNCNDVSFHSQNRNNKNELNLNGKILMESNKKLYIDMQVGYVFLNDELELQVMNSGLLTIRNKKGNVLVEEQGQWK